MQDIVPRFAALAALAASFLALVAPGAAAQEGGGVFGRVLDSRSGEPVAGASVTVEGMARTQVADNAGRYALTGVPPGPQVLVVERLGYATARIAVTVPVRGMVHRDVQLAETALELPGLTVTAAPVARARGELGTASVIAREAVEVQSATSLAGILELVPGVELKPPGLGGVQQIPLRAVPTSSVSGLVLGDPSPADLASLGTLILLDGVPLSNNANLQTTGPRGEVAVASSARGGVDLRRIPASTIDRVEVIRGIPSARYGDLTQGVVVVETRAGEFAAAARTLFDPYTAGGSFVEGWRVGGAQAFSVGLDATRTLVAPGWRDDRAYRLSGQLAHRIGVARANGLAGPTAALRPRLTLDTRFDFFQVLEETPENPEVYPGKASSNRDRGLRFSGRLRREGENESRVELTASVERTQRRSMAQERLSRRAMPFTDRLDDGRAIGHYVAGDYVSRLTLEGDEWHAYARFEEERPLEWLGLQHRARAGMELRREWNSGPGYQFDIEFPPQVWFNGVQGFDRPRRFDAVPPVAASALYFDDRIVHVLPGDMALDVQAGLRLDLLHEGSWWVSGIRDRAWQPRFNAQISPRPWLALRAGVGWTAKQPVVGMLYPARQYFDVVNVNWFTPAPSERLAVLTTFVRDPTNPELGFARTRKAEAGVELTSVNSDASLSVVAFRDRTTGAVAYRSQPGFLLRERYALSDSTLGRGVPPELVEPSTGADTVPILLDVPANNLTLESRGVELTARLPQIRALRTQLEVQGSWVSTRSQKDGYDFGVKFSDFQMDERVPRAPYWEAVTLTGERGLLTYRIVHHRPDLGLVITATIQHIVVERRQNVAGIDTLAFAGYITRDGRLVPVPPEARSLPEFQDLRQPRLNTLVQRTVVPPDWLLSVQASLTLPLGGRLSFYAFNALDRKGRLGDVGRLSRTYAPLRFGLEGALPVGPLARAVTDVAARMGASR